MTAGGERADIYASADDQNIEILLKPAGFADYTITFAHGAMVLAYTTRREMRNGKWLIGIVAWKRRILRAAKTMGDMNMDA